MEGSAAPRDGGEREAPEDTESVGLHRAQELLDLLAAVVFHRRPLRERADELQSGWILSFPRPTQA